MKTKNMTKVLLLVAITILLVGLVNATTTNKTSTTKDTKIIKDVAKTSVKTATKTVKEPAKKVTNNTVTKKKITNNKFNQSKKTATTYTVSTYTELVNQVENTDFSSDEVYTINLKKGNYSATKTINFEGNPETLIINGNGATLNGKNTYQFITLNSEESTVIFNNICFVNYTGGYGGVIDGSYGTPIIINNSKFYNNKAKYDGGTIHSNSLTISNSIFSNNLAPSGGAITCDGNTNITNTIFTNNRANSGITYPDVTDCGGAIENFGNLNIHNSSFANNIAEKDGGAIYNYGTLNIKNSTFKENQGKNWKGGALYNCQDAFMDVSNNIFKQNQILSEDTGAIINLYGSITLKNNKNDKTSNYYSTICNEGTAIITNNIFDDGIKNTKITLKLNNTKPYKGSKVKATITLKDNYGKILKNQEITIKFGNKTYTLKTNSKGIASKVYKTTYTGTIKVTSIFAGTTTYLKSTKTSNIKVLPKIKTKLTLKLSKSKAKVKEKIKITTTLKNKSNKAIKNQKVAIKIGSKTYTKKTNKKGTISFTYKVVKAALGKAIKATYKGNYMYFSSKTSRKLLKA